MGVLKGIPLPQIDSQKNRERSSKCGFQRLLVILIGWKSHLGRPPTWGAVLAQVKNRVFWSFLAILGILGQTRLNTMAIWGYRNAPKCPKSPKIA